MHKKFRTYSDGGARGNPGPAAYGGMVQVLETSGNYVTVKEVKHYLGETTNNQAEYKGLIAVLEAAQVLGAEEVECLLDSELVVKQMNREYRVKDQDLAQLFLKVWNLETTFKKISFRHIPRAQNKEADRLVNEAIDAAVDNK